jgi:hypothetical protein
MMALLTIEDRKFEKIKLAYGVFCIIASGMTGSEIVDSFQRKARKVMVKVKREDTTSQCDHT